MLPDRHLVPEAGLEPARPRRQRILNPSCLPIPPLWQWGASIPALHGFSSLYVNAILIAVTLSRLPAFKAALRMADSLAPSTSN